MVIHFDKSVLLPVEISHKFSSLSRKLVFKKITLYVKEPLNPMGILFKDLFVRNYLTNLSFCI
jgi:hypothetical protein